MSAPTARSDYLGVTLVGEFEQAFASLVDSLQTLADVTISKFADPAVSRIDETQPSLILVAAADLLGADGPRWIHRLRPSVHLVLAVGDGQDSRTCEAVLKLGCRGMLYPEMAPALLSRALHSIRNGELWFPRAIMSRMLSEHVSSKALAALTSREKEILGLLTQDRNNQQIADELFISRETVRWHIRGLYAKLGIHDRRAVSQLGQQIRPRV